MNFHAKEGRRIRFTSICFTTLSPSNRRVPAPMPAELRLGIRKLYDFSYSCDEIATVRGPFRSLRSLKRTSILKPKATAEFQHPCPLTFAFGERLFPEDWKEAAALEFPPSFEFYRKKPESPTF